MSFKNFLFFFVFLALFSPAFFVYAIEEEGSCEYQAEIDECIEANKNGGALEIENFVCIQSSDREEIAYQIVMDKKFKEIDEKAEEEVKNIEENCDEWFGEDAQEDPLIIPDKIEDIYGDYGKYWKEYNDTLDPSKEESVLQETINCLGGRTSSAASSDFFNPSLARGMFEKHLRQYGGTAYDQTKLCKQKVRQDERKKTSQIGNKKYQNLYDIMDSVVAYIEQIMNQWPSKTKQAQGS